MHYCCVGNQQNHVFTAKGKVLIKILQQQRLTGTQKFVEQFFNRGL